MLQTNWSEVMEAYHKGPQGPAQWQAFEAELAAKYGTSVDELRCASAWMHGDKRQEVYNGPEITKTRDEVYEYMEQGMKDALLAMVPIFIRAPKSWTLEQAEMFCDGPRDKPYGNSMLIELQKKLQETAQEWLDTRMPGELKVESDYCPEYFSLD